MNTNLNPNQEALKRKSIPLWAGLIMAFVVWNVLPWAISLPLPRFGWTDMRPGGWNLLGLLLVILGNIGLYRGINDHSAQTPSRIDFELDKLYLLTTGCYRYSRNPMYVAELILMFGWVIFYGSIAVLVGLFVWWTIFNFYAVPKEERILEARFGQAYREYKNQVPRWLGKIRN